MPPGRLALRRETFLMISFKSEAEQPMFRARATGDSQTLALAPALSIWMPGGSNPSFEKK
jgi:hypothetical protein